MSKMRNSKFQNIKVDSKLVPSAINKKSVETPKPKKSLLPYISVIVILIVAAIYIIPKISGVAGGKPHYDMATPSGSGGVVIHTQELSTTAKYYYHNYQGTRMEFFAVKDSSGVTRVAFNSCQVCYSSGKGYFLQSGFNMVCQNCGNVYGLSQIGKDKGGCNPAPMAVDGETTELVIDSSVFAENKYLFK
jgi:uncharacterized membrane protein